MLDVLVNNAAAYPDWQETPLTTDLDGLDVAWRTNVVGPWRLAQALAPLLASSVNPRIVNVTSGSGSHGDPQFGLGSGPGMAPYAVTKAAANALTRKLAAGAARDAGERRRPRADRDGAGHGGDGARPVSEGAASVVWAAKLGQDGPTGGFFRDGNPHPW